MRKRGTKKKSNRRQVVDVILYGIAQGRCTYMTYKVYLRTCIDISITCTEKMGFYSFYIRTRFLHYIILLCIRMTDAALSLLLFGVRIISANRMRLSWMKIYFDFGFHLVVSRISITLDICWSIIVTRTMNNRICVYCL